jgi:hypothetical protein
VTSRHDERRTDVSLAAALHGVLAFRLFLVNLASMMVVAFGEALPGSAGLRWVILAVLVVVAAHGMGVGGAVAVAGVAWLYGVGFVSHELGVLTPLGREELAWGGVLALAGMSAACWSLGR